MNRLWRGFKGSVALLWKGVRGFFGIFAKIGRLIKRGKNKLIESLRFSIKFKLALSYTWNFFWITTFMMVGIMVSYHYGKEIFPSGQYGLFLFLALVSHTVIGTLLMSFIGFRSARRVLKPVKEMTSLVQEISVKDMEQRINIAGSKNELKDLAQTFNSMMDRLQISIEQQNRFVSDASHELRTPIAVVQGYANLLDRWGKDDREVLEEAIEALKGEGEAMKRLVENLLFLARGDQERQVIEKEFFPLNGLISEVAKESQMIDRQHVIVNEKNIETNFFGDRKLLKECIRILMDNSMKYTPEGKLIKLNSYTIGNGLFIVVEDEGIGIAEDDIPHIFNRFYRADQSRTKTSGGTGLGLAIAKYIVDAHFGEIKAYSRLNEGTVITMRFPL